MRIVRITAPLGNVGAAADRPTGSVAAAAPMPRIPSASRRVQPRDSDIPRTAPLPSAHTCVRPYSNREPGGWGGAKGAADCRAGKPGRAGTVSRLGSSGGSGRSGTMPALPRTAGEPHASRHIACECYDACHMMLAAAGVLLCLAAILGVVGLRALRTFVRSLWPH